MSKKSKNELSALKDNNSFKEIVKYMPEHKNMLAIIENGLPEITRATSLFGKSQSQFMDNMLTITHPTPLRNIKQILAEMNKTRGALKEAYFSCKKKEINIKLKLRELDNCEDLLKIEMLEIELLELRSQLEESKLYISGAIRKLTNYQIQYDSILKEFGVENFNEIDYEAEEERYHIMKAFEQGLTSARTRGGTIDEGNQIYLSQIGVNGAVAQREVLKYLSKEGKMLTDNKEPTYDMQLEFLNEMADKFKGSAKKLAKSKGQTGSITEIASLVTGNTSLLDLKKDK